MTRARSFAVMALVAGATACVGQAASEDDDDPAQGGGGGNQGGRAGKGGTAGAGSGGSTASCAWGRDALPPARIWRLSATQLAATLDRTFGVQLDPKRLPGDGIAQGEFASYENVAASAAVFDQLAAAYIDVASAASEALLPKLRTAHACVTTSVSDACARELVGDVGAKAFRRPASNEEIARYASFVTQAAGKHGADHAVRMLVQSVLLAPDFLYRSELGEPRGDLRVLGAYELASALSYGLADVPPDAELMDVARSGRLLEPDERSKQAARLIASTEGRRKLVDFFQQLLRLKPLAAGTVAKDAKLFPQWDAALAASLGEETTTFIDRLIVEERASYVDLFASDHSYLDARAAKLYGAAAPSGSGFVRTTVPRERAGLLGQASLLATFAHAESTSPTHRGLLFYQTLLCRSVPPPPAGAAELGRLKLFNPDDPEATQREHFEHAKKHAPECAACHAQFIPLGLGLERFDAVGVYRTTENGRNVDPRVDLRGADDADGSYADGIALGKAIAASAAGQRCFAQQLAGFTLGREIDAEASGCGVESLVARWKARELRLPDLLALLAASDAFVLRR